MRRLLAFTVVLALAGQAQAVGLLIPKEKEVPPLAMLNHQVNITIEDQVAVTKVEQTFRNHTSSQLEATYVFPVPKGASVTKFTMWVNGKPVSGEMIEAKKAKKIYLDIVQKTQDPGLLEYLDHNMLKVSVFPILPNSDQKISFSYTSIVPKDNDIINYTYPLKTDGKAIQTLEKFSVKVELKSQHPLQNIYSPSHSITVTRPSDKQANIVFQKDEGKLDRNFQLYYTAGSKDVGLTALAHRPIASDKGYFMLLVSPRSELSKEQQVPRDMVFVLDTSGSMRGKRMEQARNALNYCLSNLNPQDRFAIVQFATGVHKYSDQWLKADKDQIAQAKKWVNNLEATGGTAINDALATALDMRSNDKSRTFTIVFFTDGRPTIGETNAENIMKNVMGKNTANTRIFTFGVGDDVNATMLDQLAEKTKAVSDYVRENEDIEAHVSSLYGKISNPVLTDLKLTVSNGVKLTEIYPPQLPDLFHGSQLVVLGRYEGNGHAAITLSGNVGKDQKEFVYEIGFPEKTSDEKPFVEDLWARRKVGYLLDQIRLNGEQKELMEEVVTLAKKYGITTPYTSYLIVPDETLPVAKAPLAKSEKGAGKGKEKPDVSFHLIPGGGTTYSSKTPPPVLQPGFGGGFNGGFGGGFGGGPGGFPGQGGYPKGFGGTSKGPDPGTPGSTITGPVPTGPVPVADFVQKVQGLPGNASYYREKLAEHALNDPKARDDKDGGKSIKEAQELFQAYNTANKALKDGDKGAVQGGQVGVNLSIASNFLRQQSQLTNSAVRRVANTNCLEVGGVWIDEAYHAKQKTVTVKAMSKAYFRILEKYPKMKEIYSLGNHLVWVTPSGTALVLDTSTGRTEMPDAEIDALFVQKK